MRSTTRQLRGSRRRSSRRTAPKAAGRSSVTQPSRQELGYSAGYEDGKRAGMESFETLFDGTSIIIPTYNQAKYLKACVESIGEHTDLPYEIIIIDNGSTDETAAYLKEISTQVRYRILEDNHGFAGAVNMGLMMAKGTTLMLLNNDVLVTDNWLDNLLACLNSEAKIGMVGPVTNYISGDQQIDVPYTDVMDMYEFARRNNESNPARWVRTDRLVGFCLLFRRELLEKVGYLDEGFEIGNFEDDDFNIRVRLHGYSLVIAKDSFIHHFGSVSMKATGQQFEGINERNMRFYINKWGNPHELVHQVNEWRRLQEELAGTPPLLNGMIDFYPQHVSVKGVGETVYWLADGQRRPLMGPTMLPVVRLSQVDMCRYPIGEPIGADDPLVVAAITRPVDSVVTTSTDGTRYIVEAGKKRRITTQDAAERWGLDRRYTHRMSDAELSSLPDGLPIIAPVVLHQSL
ncbi:GT2 family glycosyltransferase [Paenibacillus cellulosilyticus]|uniref:GT2 family glycosyltransferase n=1 Tax=Paenibacillus cellulosilyticus TaxID=375489 RepID=A0A2V2Z2L1_9BACL|nr:glycosyltransferase family 2 protein [Paenibacillus cellulosilyticus]PWW07355.1 GT2 family glycosyltransferase [Paenibacillus cellulosilyticus]